MISISSSLLPQRLTLVPAPDSRLAVAELPADITETALLAHAPAWLVAAGVPAALTHPQRRREWLAGRLLAGALLAELGAAELEIVTDEFGRPQLHAAAGTRAGAVSLSHGGGYIAAVVAPGPARRAGLDLEPERPKTLTLAPRWLAPPELAAVGASVSRASLAWSLKETLYKVYGRRQLDFRQHLHLDVHDWPTPTDATTDPLPSAGRVPGRIIHPTATAPARAWSHVLHFRRAVPGCWLTYCVG